MPLLPDVWIALAGALFGGAGLKVIEHWLTRTKRNDDSAAAFRKELREEVAGLRQENDRVTDEADQYREMYYKAVEAGLAAKAELVAVVMEARQECAGFEYEVPSLAEWLRKNEITEKEAIAERRKVRGKG